MPLDLCGGGGSAEQEPVREAQILTHERASYANSRRAAAFRAAVRLLHAPGAGTLGPVRGAVRRCGARAPCCAGPLAAASLAAALLHGAAPARADGVGWATAQAAEPTRQAEARAAAGEADVAQRYLRRSASTRPTASAYLGWARCTSGRAIRARRSARTPWGWTT